MVRGSGATLFHRGDQIASRRAGGAFGGSQVEPFLAEAPADGGLLLGVWQQGRLRIGALGIAVALSDDDGTRWVTRQLPGLTSCERGPYRLISDPEDGIGPDGRMYVSMTAEGPSGQASRSARHGVLAALGPFRSR